MKTQTTNCFIICLLTLTMFSTPLQARAIFKGTTSVVHQKAVMAVCSPATSQVVLDINNVRARILMAGDMWWNLSTNAGYEVPAGSGKHSLFTGAIWIGGTDAGGILKTAAMTYRQTGNDFWAGPLSSAATTDAVTCNAWDEHFKINKQAASDYYFWVAGGSIGPNPVSASEMSTINNWPVLDPEGNPMAPFWDVNGNSVYEPWLGEIPDFDVTNTRPCIARLHGDQCIYWVFNDKGNVHTETGGQSIGIEVRAMAFAYSTTDALNDATFYQYKVINRSSFSLFNTYFGQFVDPDLGSAGDDYVGCDVSRSLAFCYNGAATDAVYGSTPPAVGIDFLEGPFADVGDGIDNDRDSVIDEAGEKILMSKFIYYKNNTTVQGNPSGATDFYDYLQGNWKDGSQLTYGGTGYSGATQCDFMFPGNSDPVGWGVGGTPSAPLPQTAWNETAAAGDRRFLQSAGKFTMYPGSINTITTAAVWAKASSGGPSASMAAMLAADDLVQQVFNGCFSTLTSVSENNGDQLEITLSPNPFSDEAYLNFNNPNSSAYTLRIFDAAGKLVDRYDNVNSGKILISRKGKKNGHYTYNLSDNANHSKSGKFIIK